MNTRTSPVARDGYANVAKAKLLSGHLKDLFSSYPPGDGRRSECLIMMMFLLDVIEGRATSASNNDALQQIEDFCLIENQPMENRIDFRMSA